MCPSEKAVLSHCPTQRRQTNCVGASVPFNLRMEGGPVPQNGVFLLFIADDEAKKQISLKYNIISKAEAFRNDLLYYLSLLQCESSA
jgi:hypothetical protein